MGDHRLPQEGHVGRARKRGKTWTEGKGEMTDGLRGRGSSGVWYHGGLEIRRARQTLRFSTGQYAKGAVGLCRHE